jgi:large subunit ribosomal protein L22
MGARKRLAAAARKEARKSVADAKLNNVPTSPQKMRLVADLVRGMNVETALGVLRFNPREASNRLEKLLLSAINNWQAKNEGKRMEESNLYVKEIHVDGGRMLKRLRPAPQGRGYRVRKRSNHVTLVVDSRVVTNETKEVTA